MANVTVFEYIIVYGLVFSLGAVLGSFFILVGSRTSRKASIIRPHSHCDYCNKKLDYWELIPIVSWLILRGRCRSCHNKIPFLSFVLELLSGLVFVLTCFLLSWSVETIVGLTLYLLLICITVSDLENQIIPNKVLLPFLFIGLVERLVLSPTINWWNNPIVGFGIGFGVLYLLAYVSNGGMGGGDIKLLAVIGVFLGSFGVLLTLFIGSVLGLLYAIFSGAYINKKKKIAFGPFLAIGAWIVYLFMTNQIQLLFYYIH